MDALANEVVDFMHESDALQNKVVKPLKRKLFPYLACFAVSNILILIVVVFIAVKVMRSQNNITA